MTTQQRIEIAQEIISKEHSGSWMCQAIIQLINICDNQQKEIDALISAEKTRLQNLNQ